MERRKFIALLGSAAALSVVARAQESVVRIGFLPLGSPSNRYDLSYVEAFRKGLVENGLIDGKNVVVDLVWVANEPEYDQAVVELIRRGAKILVPAGSSASVAAKRQTSTIPIIFIGVGNPLGIGIVQSLSRPSGNATGFTDVLADLSSKLVDFAREINAQGSPVGYLWFDKWPDGRNRFAGPAGSRRRDLPSLARPARRAVCRRRRRAEACGAPRGDRDRCERRRRRRQPRGAEPRAVRAGRRGATRGDSVTRGRRIIARRSGRPPTSASWLAVRRSARGG